LKIFGTAKEKTSVISFNIEGIHPYDIGNNWQIRNSG
jgi:cysteine desulfurase/selenocysteine lyase